MARSSTQNPYSMPVSPEAVTLIVQDNPSHTGAYEGSIDFAVPLGTPVLAGADGVVTRVRVDSDKYGNDLKFGQDANYITIEHPHDELSEYLHLAKGSAAVRPGDKVKRGQKIAETGLSGWLTDPHLHWMVYKKAKSFEDFQCLQIVLRESYK